MLAFDIKLVKLLERELVEECETDSVHPPNAGTIYVFLSSTYRQINAVCKNG